jgi:ubiquinone/menaquinone biosynthesis C-methylase UbiE
MFHDWPHAGEVRRRQIESGKDVTFTRIFLPYYRELVAKINPRRALEIGCGTGHLAKSLAEKVPELVAIDPSLGM